MRQSSGAIKVEVKSLGLALPHQRYEDCLDFQLTAQPVGLQYSEQQLL